MPLRDVKMECDGCTLCCKVLDIPWMNSPAGEYCKECEPGVGCKIWDSVPEHCKKYNCAYRLVEKVNINLRPDKSGVVFEKATDKIFFGTITEGVYMLNEETIAQINKFLEKGFSVVLRHLEIREHCVFNTEDRTSDDVWKEYKEAVNKWQEFQHIKQT